MFFGVRYQLAAGVKPPFAPGRNNLYVGIMRKVDELKSHLVIPLSGGTVADGISPLDLGNLHLAFGD